MVDFTALAAPFDPARISWRVGSTKADKSSGLALAYIDARDVYERLDHVVGPANWQCRYPHAGQKTVCEIGIRVGDEWVWKANGAGDSDVEAEKGAMSDALKRAAVAWGIGRYLYELPNVWVDLKPAGKSFAIASGQEAKLARALKGAAPEASTKPTISERAVAAIAPKPEPEIADRIERDLIDRIGKAQDMKSLRGLVTDDWQASVSALSPEAQGRVRASYAAAQREIDQLAVAGTP